MRKKNPFISLDKICERNDFILVDTCALGDEERKNIRTNFSAIYLEKRYQKACRTCINLSLWNEKIRTYDKIRFTKGVLGELSHYWNAKFLKEIKHFDYIGYDEKTKDCLLILNDNRKFANKIIHFAGSNKRVYDLKNSQEKIYQSFVEENQELFEEVGKTDFQLLVSGMVLSELNYKVGIITADSKMVKAYKSFVEYEFFKEINFYKSLRKFSFKKYGALINRINPLSSDK